MGAADGERGDSAGMEIDGDSSRTRRASRDSSRTRMASTTKSRPRSGTTGPKATLNPEQAKQLAKKERSLERHVWRNASRGEADRMHYPKLVKHMNSGKSSLGTSTIGR